MLLLLLLLPLLLLLLLLLLLAQLSVLCSYSSAGYGPCRRSCCCNYACVVLSDARLLRKQRPLQQVSEAAS